jgi:uroporphyrinogen-III synthase
MRVLVTRTAEQGSALGTLLAEAGAEVVELATIAIEPLADRSALDDALRRAGDYAWVVFTSANGVEHALGSGPTVLPRVAVVGRATGAALKRQGIQPSFAPSAANGRTLADELPIAPGERVLLLRSDVADGELPRRLVERGALVDDVAAYRTVPRADGAPELRARLVAGAIDAALLASPSSVRGLLEACGGDRALLAPVRLVAIGPTTARAIEELGLAVAAQAREQSGEGLVAALVELVGRVAGESRQRPTPDPQHPV